jgi:hypothetical protein
MLQRIISILCFLAITLASQTLYGTENLADLFQSLIMTKHLSPKTINDEDYEKTKQLFSGINFDNVYKFEVHGPHAQEILEAIRKNKRDTKDLQQIRWDYEFIDRGKKLQFLLDKQTKYPGELLIAIAASPYNLYTEGGIGIEEIAQSALKLNSKLLNDLITHINPLAEQCAQLGGKMIRRSGAANTILFSYNDFRTKEQIAATTYSLTHKFLEVADYLYKKQYIGIPSTVDPFKVDYESAHKRLKDLVVQAEMETTFKDFTEDQKKMVTQLLLESGSLASLASVVKDKKQ